MTIAKTEAHYQYTPKGKEQCSKCTMFRSPRHCTLVRGLISAMGWCKFFEAKKKDSS